MLERDIKNAFGHADDETRELVHNTLARLNRGGHTRMGFRLKAAAAVIAACFIIPTFAYAAFHRFGLSDFIGGRVSNGLVLPGASEIVQTDISIEAEQTDFATFDVRDAIFAGNDIYFTVAITPRDKDTLLIPFYLSKGDPVQRLFPSYQGQETIGDYASANGKALVMAEFTWIYFDGSAWEYRFEDDGTLIFLISGKYAGEPADILEIELSFIFYTAPDYSEDPRITETISFTLKNTGHIAEASSSDAVLFADAGVRVDRVALTASEMSVNVSIEFTVTDAEKFTATDYGLWFELLTDDGEPYPTIGSGVIRPFDKETTQLVQDAGTRFVQEISISAMETLPDHIVIRGYNCWDKTRYEKHTVEID